MEFATNLSTGKTYEAVKVSYSQAHTLRLVCPVCKEKVFKLVRRIPQETHMFAHHKGGSPDCELYFPSVSDASSGTNLVGISRGQTFEKFISDIDTDLRRLVIAAGFIPDGIVDERLVKVISVLVKKELQHLKPSFFDIENAGRSLDGNETASVRSIAVLLFEFYSRDGARFCDALFCKWFLYGLWLKYEKIDIESALGTLSRERSAAFSSLAGLLLSGLAGLMLSGLARLYAGEDLTRFREELDLKLTLHSGRLPLCEGAYSASWTNCIGTATFTDGAKYVGEFKDGMMNGHGTKTSASGAKYVGEHRDDKRSGQGTYTSASGAKYVGEYRDGKRSGQGTETWPSGAKYVGEYRDGKRSGQGTYTWPDGQKYVGEYRDGKRSGQGTETWPSGEKYVGEFKDDKRHGQGTYTLASGEKYVGEYRDGKRSGQGTETWPSGAKYVGEYRDGKMHGQGTLTRPNGSVIHSGLWADDQPVR